MKRVLLLILILGLLLTGCGNGTGNPESDIEIYAFCPGDTALTSYGYSFSTDETRDRINMVFELLKSSSGDYDSILSDVLYVDNWILAEDGILQVTFGDRYYEQETGREVMARGAIVKTLCQLEEVNGVSFYVLLNDAVPDMREELVINGEQLGVQYDTDYISDIGYSVETTRLTLYYGSASGDRLVPVDISVETNDNYTLEQQVILALISEAVPEGLVRTVNPETVVNRIVTRDYVCYVDLSEEFLSLPETVTPEVCIYSIVNSLCELDIANVVFTVNGESREMFGTMNFSQVFSADSGLVVTEETE